MLGGGRFLTNIENFEPAPKQAAAEKPAVGNIALLYRCVFRILHFPANATELFLALILFIYEVFLGGARSDGRMVIKIGYIELWKGVIYIGKTDIKGKAPARTKNEVHWRSLSTFENSHNNYERVRKDSTAGEIPAPPSLSTRTGHPYMKGMAIFFVGPPQSDGFHTHE